MCPSLFCSSLNFNSILLQHNNQQIKFKYNINASLMPHTHKNTYARTVTDDLKKYKQQSKCQYHLHLPAWLASTHKTHIIPLLRSNDVDYPQLIIYNTWQSCFRCTPKTCIPSASDIHHCSLKTTCLYLLPHLLFNFFKKLFVVVTSDSTNGRYEDELTFIFLNVRRTIWSPHPFWNIFCRPIQFVFVI